MGIDERHVEHSSDEYVDQDGRHLRDRLRLYFPRASERISTSEYPRGPAQVESGRRMLFPVVVQTT